MSTPALILTICGFALTLLINVGGWIWFFATLQARVVAIEAKMAAHGAVILSLPRDYVPRSELVALLQGIEGKIDLLISRGGHK